VIAACGGSPRRRRLSPSLDRVAAQRAPASGLRQTTDDELLEAAGSPRRHGRLAKEAGKKATKGAAKATARQTATAVAKSATRGAAKSGAQRAAALLPAGASQLQFEITALFALAVADIHGTDYDQQRACTRLRSV